MKSTGEADSLRYTSFSSSGSTSTAESSFGSTQFSCVDTDSFSLSDEVLDSKKIITSYTTHPTGLLGTLERVPIEGKLACMNGFWLLGMLAFSIFLIVLQSQTLARGVAKEQFNRFIVVAGNLIHELQRERGLMSMYLHSNNTAHASLLQAQFTRTDAALAKWDAYFATNDDFLHGDSTIQADIESLARYEQEYSHVRSLKLSAAGTYHFFTNWMANILSIFYSTLGTLDKYALIVTIKEKASNEKAIASGMIASGVARHNAIARIASLMHDQQLLTDLFFKIAKEDDITFFQSAMEGADLPGIAAAEAILLATPPGAPISMSAQQWFDMMSLKIDRYRLVENHFAIQMLSKKDIRNSSIIIAVIVFTLIVFIAASVFIVLLLSKVIISPWQRLQALQEDTITKFVPRGFMRLINVKQIIDVRMGTAVSRDLTAMFSDIRDFTSISERLTPEQSFQFVNMYLNEVGPVIRKYGGYIDKFLGDGFLALFTSPSNGLYASIEIQQKLDGFKRVVASTFSVEIPIRVGIGVHYGKMIVGTVGENKRMDGSIIGDAVNLTSRLESLTKRYRANILTTSSTLARIGNVTVQFKYRYIGKVRVKGKEQEVDIFEVLDGIDARKLRTSEEFSNAVLLMIQGNFEEAKKAFEKICSENPEDFAAHLKLKQCMSFLESDERSWDGIEIITEK